MNPIQQMMVSPFAEQLGWCLLHSVWQIALVGLLLKVALDLVGQRSAVIRYNLGFAALVFSLLIPVVTWLVMSHSMADISGNLAAAVVPDVEPVSAEIATVDSAPDVAAHNSGQEHSGFVLPDSETDVAAVPAVTWLADLPTTVSAGSWVSWITPGWLIGILLFSTRPLIGAVTANRLKKTSRSPVPEWVNQAVQRLAGQLRIRKRVGVFHSGQVDVPTLVGIFRPVVLLPFSSLTNLSASELDAILLHELAHVLRHDQLANILQMVIETLLFFHPVVWWMSLVVRRERENCCDDLSVASCGELTSLVRALVALEEKRINQCGLTMSARGGSLLARIQRLTDPARSGSSYTSLFSTVAVLLFAAVVASAWAITPVNAGHQPNPETPVEDELVSLEIVSTSDLHNWERCTTINPRLVHRFWNMFPPEQRIEQGEIIEDWKPDLEMKFTRVFQDGADPEVIVVQVGMQSGFRWSVGKGIWLMDSQWPLRYSLNEVRRESGLMKPVGEGDPLNSNQSGNTESSTDPWKAYQRAVNDYKFLLATKRSMELVQTDDPLPALTLRQVRSLDEELVETRKLLDELRQQQEFLDAELKKDDDGRLPWLTELLSQSGLTRSEVTEKLKDQLSILIRDRAEMVDQFDGSHPEVKLRDRQIQFCKGYFATLMARPDDLMTDPDPSASLHHYLARLAERTEDAESRLAVLGDLREACQEEARIPSAIEDELARKQVEIERLAQQLEKKDQNRERLDRTEKLFNDHAYSREQKSLAKEHAGRWVAIVDGRILASYESFEDCVKAADEANRHAGHRYIYRPGVDDQPQEFKYSPWITGQPNWWQFGIQFRRDHRIGISTDQWYVGENALATGLDGKGDFTLTSPAGDSMDSVRHPAVCSGLFSQQLTIIEDDARRLNLNRFAVPGEVQSLVYKVPCTKVLAEVSIPELGIKQRVVAFVMPQEIVDLDPPGGVLNRFDINLIPDQAESDQREATLLELLMEVMSAEEISQSHRVLVYDLLQNGSRQLSEDQDRETEKPARKSLVEAIEKMIQEGDREDIPALKDLLRRLRESDPSDTRQSDDPPSVDATDTVDHDASRSWTVSGMVTGQDGKPMGGVRVWISTGLGSLHKSDETTTDAQGNYTLTFGPSLFVPFSTSDLPHGDVNLQAAVIFAAKDGFSEVTLCQQGDRLMAETMPAEDTPWGAVDKIKDRLILKDQPVTIDFVMEPASRLEGFLVDQNGHLLQRRSLSLVGPELPPATNALEQVYLDLDARFSFEDVPIGKSWQIEFRIPNSRDVATTSPFVLESTETRKWLLTVDFEATPPTLTASPLNDSEYEKLAGRSFEDRKNRIVRGKAWSEEESTGLVWGAESNGLQAALQMKGGSTYVAGDIAGVNIVVRNVSDEQIEFESETWRQEDTLKVWSVGDDPRKQNVNKIWYSGIAIYKTYVLEPGEQVALGCGGIGIASSEHAVPAPGHPTVYSVKLIPGTYTASLRFRIPAGWNEVEGWKGSLTTGDVELIVK